MSFLFLWQLVYSRLISFIECLLTEPLFLFFLCLCFFYFFFFFSTLETHAKALLYSSCPSLICLFRSRHFLVACEFNIFCCIHLQLILFKVYYLKDPFSLISINCCLQYPSKTLFSVLQLFFPLFYFFFFSMFCDVWIFFS